MTSTTDTFETISDEQLVTATGGFDLGGIFNGIKGMIGSAKSGDWKGALSGLTSMIPGLGGSGGGGGGE